MDGGSGICNAVYVDNLVTAMWKAATVPEARNETFIVSDLERTTWQDLYFSVAAGVGVPPETIASVPTQVVRDMLARRRGAGWLEGAKRTRLAARIRECCRPICV